MFILLLLLALLEVISSDVAHACVAHAPVRVRSWLVRKEQDTSRRKSAGGRWMPAGDSQPAGERENRQAR